MSLFKKKVKTVTSDEAINVVQSIAKAKMLYKSLCSKCHPDRFPNNPEKQRLAEEVFKEVVKNKYSYSNLMEIEERINNEF